MAGRIEVLETAKKQLRDAGIVSHECEAEALLMFVLGADRVNLYTQDIDITDGQRLFFESFIKDRMRGVPLQHLVGKTEFFGLPFFIEPGVFIPRPETEILVEAVLNLLNHRPSTDDCRFLDLCTGSGNIAICLAKHVNCAKIIATDISKKSIEAAAKNARVNGVEDKIEFRVSDLFENAGLRRKFDAVVSNPPYIRRGDLKLLPEEVRREPVIALNGGADGLHFYRKIIQASPAYLKEGGFLAVEFGDGQAQKVKETAAANPFFGDIEIIRDLNGVERVLIARTAGGP